MAKGAVAAKKAPVLTLLAQVGRSPALGVATCSSETEVEVAKAKYLNDRRAEGVDVSRVVFSVKKD